MGGGEGSVGQRLATQGGGPEFGTLASMQKVRHRHIPKFTRSQLCMFVHTHQHTHILTLLASGKYELKSLLLSVTIITVFT